MSRKQKVGCLIILFAMIFQSMLELLGIALVSPILNIIQARNIDDPIGFINYINKNFFSNIVCKFFNINPVIHNANLIISVMLGVVIFIYLFKFGYSILNKYCISIVLRSISRKISFKIISANLAMPYDYFVNTNSSIIIRKCTSDVVMFMSTIRGILGVITSFFIALAILTYLMIKSWIITLIFAVLIFICAIASVFILRNYSKRTGKKLREYHSENLDILHKSIFGIKETKINEVNSYFINDFIANRIKSDTLSLKYNILVHLPGQIIENFAIILVMSITILLVCVLPNSDSNYIVELLTSFVLAAIKLLPNVLAISGNFVSFSYFSSAVDSVLNDLKEADEINKRNEIIKSKYGNKKIQFHQKISIENLTFSYRSSPIIIKDVNVQINKGEYVAFSGNSGAGKTTLIDNLLGLLSPQKGNIFCDNHSIYENIKSWHSLISYVPQTIFLLDDSIKKNICFGLDVKFIDENKVWKALEKAQLKEFVEKLPNKLETRIGEAGVKLSGGQRQRIGIARAFYKDTPIMVLDEATSALDYGTEDNILLNIRKVKGDKTVIIITHRLNTISHCDKIYCIENHICKQIK